MFSRHLPKQRRTETPDNESDAIWCVAGLAAEPSRQAASFQVEGQSMTRPVRITPPGDEEPGDEPQEEAADKRRGNRTPRAGHFLGASPRRNHQRHRCRPSHANWQKRRVSVSTSPRHLLNQTRNAKQKASSRRSRPFAFRRRCDCTHLRLDDLLGSGGLRPRGG